MNHGGARFNRLVRLFSHRLVESEMLAETAEPHQTFVTIFSLLGAFGFVFGILDASRYLLVLDHIPKALRMRAMWGDQLVLVLLSMAVTGFLSVLAWDAMLPGRKDAMVLGSLPIRARTLFAARLYALGQFFFLFTIALNSIPGLLLPTLSITRHDWVTNWLQLAFAQFAGVVSASAIVFASAIAVQALPMLLLPWRVYQALSAILQISFLLGSFGILFMTPGIDWAIQSGAWWVKWIPAYWYVGLWQQIGGLPPAFDPSFARTGAIALVAVCGTSALLMAAASGVAMRKIVEGLEKKRSGPGIVARAFRTAAERLVLRRQAERAVFWFAARTVLRHRGRRLLLGLYVGLGIACAMWGISESMRRKEAWAEPAMAACLVLVQLMMLAQIGMRALYGLPVDLRANWAFRMTGTADPSERLAGARKLLILAGLLPIPVLILIYVAAWGAMSGLVFAALCCTLAWSVGEWHCREMRLIPFACAMAPGKSNVKVKLGAWGVLFFALTTFWAGLAVSVLTSGKWRQVIVLLLVTTAPGAWVAFSRWRESGGAPPLLFEETQAAEVEPVRLSF